MTKFFNEISFYWMIIRKTIKRFFKFIIESIGEMFVDVFFTILVILYKILSIVVGFTTIGFIAGLILLYFNIKEAFGGVMINDTKYFIAMLYLFGAHIIVFTLYRFFQKKLA